MAGSRPRAAGQKRGVNPRDKPTPEVSLIFDPLFCFDHQSFRAEDAPERGNPSKVNQHNQSEAVVKKYGFRFSQNRHGSWMPIYKSVRGPANGVVCKGMEFQNFRTENPVKLRRNPRPVPGLGLTQAQ